MIQISGIYGSPQADDRIWPIHRRLNQWFEAHVEHTSAEDDYSLYLRFCASGQVTPFDGEGLTDLELNTKDQTVCADFVVAENTWMELDQHDLSVYLISAVRSFLQAARRAMAEVGHAMSDAFQDSVELALRELEAGAN